MSLMKAALQHPTQFPISVKALQRAVTELRDVDRIRTLEGNYIATPSIKNSKYHFHKNYPLWKMLVTGYMLSLAPLALLSAVKTTISLLKAD